MNADEKQGISSELIQLPFATMKFREEGILEIRINPYHITTSDDLRFLHKLKGGKGGGKKYPNLIVMGFHSSADHTARAFSASEESQAYRKADAFVISSLAQRIIANFYIKVQRPKVPTRFFNNEELALNWLRTFLPKK
ncbi:MAG TPA: hypothetical protein PK798_08550 [Flavobacteriales bacterium]|nr:hypothetical protein [Flavobacteriales bacterium]HRJ35512.1 hypothetical protein [Flavobacteriales bacterium]HRJ38825.1 hypothetical protein [Flavobacteriales bacterium]